MAFKKYTEGYPQKVFYCDTEADLAAIPLSEISAGDKALVISEQKEYVANTQGEWKLMQDFSGNGGSDDTNSNVKIYDIILTSDAIADPMPCKFVESGAVGYF